MRILAYLALLLLAAIQLPAWAWAKLRGRSYQWWGGPQ